MTDPQTSEKMTIECTFQIERRGRNGVEVKTTEPQVEPGRLPRVTRLMALAIRCDRLFREGKLADRAALCRFGRITRARVAQILNLLNLAPDIQEELLFLPRVQAGRDPIILAQLQPIAQTHLWSTQRRLWKGLRRTLDDRRVVEPVHNSESS